MPTCGPHRVDLGTFPRSSALEAMARLDIIFVFMVNGISIVMNHVELRHGLKSSGNNQLQQSLVAPFSKVYQIAIAKEGGTEMPRDLPPVLREWKSDS